MLKAVKINSGALAINISSIQKPYTNISDLLSFASRQNAKRKFLFVSNILGKHIPTKPSVMRESYDLLAGLIGPWCNSTFVVGMAETAIGLGGGIADSLAKIKGSGKVIFQNTTRHHLVCNKWFEICEEHCHAPSHIIYEPLPELIEDIKSCERIVLIDDEISTGKTLQQLAQKIQLKISNTKEIVIVSLVNWLSNEREQWFLNSLNDFCTEHSIDTPKVRFVQLAKGSFDFDEDKNFNQDLPEKTDTDIETRYGNEKYGRRGIRMPVEIHLIDEIDYKEIVKPISVVGYCEHVLFPFFKAEAIEKLGKSVVFQSFTRSPVYVDNNVIQSVEFNSFTRSNGKELNHYIYNLDRDKFHIINETETEIPCMKKIIDSKVVVFTDVDDTLLSSIGKINQDASYLPVAVNKEGEHVGFSTFPQLALIDMFASKGLLVPVTGRNKETLYCYKSDWEGPQIVSHGAIVLTKDGLIDKDWINEIEPEIEQAKPILKTVLDSINEIVELNKTNDEGRSRIITDQGVDVYFCAKYRDENLLDLIEDCLKFYKTGVPGCTEWIIHRNGRNIAFLPTYASKARAVKFLQKKLGLNINDLTIGVGDSTSDLSFMHECSFAIYPKNSQINSKLINS